MQASLQAQARDPKRLAMILKTYQVYFRKLAFEQLPRLAERFLGRAGFRIVVDALAEATVAALPGLLEATRGLVEVPQGDPLKVLEVHYSCHTAAREITGDNSISLFKPIRVSENRLELVAEECPFNADGLQLAAFAGIAVGVLRALKAPVVAISEPGEERYLEPGTYAVWAEKRGKGCAIVAEKIVKRA